MSLPSFAGDSGAATLQTSSPNGSSNSLLNTGSIYTNYECDLSGSKSVDGILNGCASGGSSNGGYLTINSAIIGNSGTGTPTCDNGIYCGARLDKTTTQSVAPIDAFSLCRWVDSNTDTADVFVPFGQQNDWQSFISNAPTSVGVKLTSCGLPNSVSNQSGALATVSNISPYPTCTTATVNTPNVYGRTGLSTWTAPTQNFTCHNGATTVTSNFQWIAGNADSVGRTALSWNKNFTYSPDLTLTATSTSNPSNSGTNITVVSGTPVNLTWVTASGATYTTGWNNSTGWGSGSQQVTPAPAAPATSVTYTAYSTENNLTSTAFVTVNIAQPLTVSVTASPTEIDPGASTILTWAITNSSGSLSCRASSSDKSWTSSITSANGTANVIPNATSGSVIYTLTCSDSLQSNISGSATVMIGALAACGSDNNQTLASAPTNLCATGTSSNMISTSSGWVWSCSPGYGSATSCSATLQTPASVAGVCGSSVASCAEGSVINASGTTWTCTGINGGADASCSAGTSGRVDIQITDRIWRNKAPAEYLDTENLVPIATCTAGENYKITSVTVNNLPSSQWNVPIIPPGGDSYVPQIGVTWQALANHILGMTLQCQNTTVLIGRGQGSGYQPYFGIAYADDVNVVNEQLPVSSLPVVQSNGEPGLIVPNATFDATSWSGP